MLWFFLGPGLRRDERDGGVARSRRCATGGPALSCRRALQDASGPRKGSKTHRSRQYDCVSHLLSARARTRGVRERRLIVAQALPANPSLDHLRREARALQRACLAGDAEAGRRLVAAFPQADPSQAPLTMAQAVIARGYGFAGWPA